MSCITEILKIKGDRAIMPFPDNDGIVIEGGGEHKGYEYIITFTEMGHRCGYVAINPDHPLYGKDAVRNDDIGLNVHGGVTFHQEEIGVKKILSHPCKDEWIGFDAAHWDDVGCRETTEKYFGQTEWVKYMKNNSFYDELKRVNFEPQIFHKTYDYMEKECFNLIDQLIEIKNAA